MEVTSRIIPPNFREIRNAARAALGPLRSAADFSEADEDRLFNAKRTKAGAKLPPYYLVYFLLVELLGFDDRGEDEKVAWSLPVKFHDHVYLIDYRKMGLGIFAQRFPELDSETHAAEMVQLIDAASEIAEPYYNWRAEEAVRTSLEPVIDLSELVVSS